MSHAAPVVWVHYLPIFTTIVSAAFSASLFAKYRRRPSAHLWWWAFGVACYGLGTLVESTITLTGNTVFLTKAWYITGAIWAAIRSPRVRCTSRIRGARPTVPRSSACPS